MDPNELLEALKYSVGKTQQEVKLAEQYLEQTIGVNGYMPNLLLFSCNKELNLHVRQSAIVNLYSAVKQHWKRRNENEPDVLPEDKATLKDNIVEAIIKCADTPKIYNEMIEIIKYIVGFDFPKRWTSILPSIIEKLKNSNDFQEVYGALLALSAIFSYYKDILGRKPELEALVNETFNLLELFAEKLLADYGLQASAAMHVILKIFFAATYTWIPAYLLDAKNLETWMTFFKLILDKDVASELATPTEDFKILSQREKNVYWLNKKWCSRIVTSFLAKFRNVKNTVEENNRFSEMFMLNYAEPFLKTQLETLYKAKQQYLHVKVQFYSMKYIEKALKNPDLRVLLKDHLEFLLFEILIPAMFLNYKDKENWEENPIEFIRAEEDEDERSNTLKTIATYIWQKITHPHFQIGQEKVGTLILIKFMKHAAQILSNNQDPRTNQPADMRLRESMLHIIGNIHSNIMDNDEISGQMEFLLEKYVIPEFSSQVGFLRYRACWLFGMYGGFKFQNPQVVVAATEGLYKCLLDKQLPVQVQGGIALERVLEQKAALDILQPGLEMILENYINLLDVAENEHLVSAFEGIIKKFGEGIKPYALALIQRLARIFAKSLEDDEDDANESHDDLEEKQLAASGCLSAIGNILSCKLPKETLLASQEIIIPLLNFTLIDDKTDDIEGGLSILNSMIYYLDEINEKMWVYYLELNYMLSGKPQHAVAPNYDSLSDQDKFLLKHKITGYGVDYINLMIPVFQNYIQKGRNVLFTERDPYFNLIYIELLFKSIDRMFEISCNGLTDHDAASATVLYITIIENYPKDIDNLIIYFLDKVIEFLPKTKTPMWRKTLIQTVALCLWYNPTFALQYLESKGATESVFKTWIELLPRFKLDFECERIMIGLSSIFRTNVTEIPQVILTSLPDLLKRLVTLSSKIIRLREEDVDEDGNKESDDEEDLNDLEDDTTGIEDTFAKIEKFHKKHGLPTFVEKGSKEHKIANTVDDDDDEDDEDFRIDEYEDHKALEWLENERLYDSPFEGECEIMYLKASLEMMQQNQLDAYNQLIGCLSNEEKSTLQKNFEEAYRQVQEYNALKELA